MHMTKRTGDIEFCDLPPVLNLVLVKQHDWQLTYSTVCGELVQIIDANTFENYCFSVPVDLATTVLFLILHNTIFSIVNTVQYFREWQGSCVHFCYAAYSLF